MVLHYFENTVFMGGSDQKTCTSGGFRHEPSGSKRRACTSRGFPYICVLPGGSLVEPTRRKNARVYFQVGVNEKVVPSVGSSSKKLVLLGVFGKNCLFPSGMSCAFWWVLSQNRALLGGCLLKSCTSRGLRTVPFLLVATENRALPNVSSLHFEVIYSCWLDSAEALTLET